MYVTRKGDIWHSFVQYSTAISSCTYMECFGPYGGSFAPVIFNDVLAPLSNYPLHLLSPFHRVCEIKSVDGSNITTYCVHECEAANRIGMRSRRFIFTGHTNGAIQV